MLRLGAVVLALAVWAPVVGAQGVDEIVQAHLQARGGLEKIRSKASYRASGTILLQEGAIQGTMTLSAKSPNRLRVEIEIPGTRVVQAYDGTKAWRIFPEQIGGTGRPEITPPEQARQIRQQADLEGFLANYQAKGHEVSLEGIERVGGRDAHHLKVTLAAGGDVHVYLDLSSHQLVRQVTKSVLPGLGEIEIENLYGDYRAVEGLMVPFWVEVRTQGATLQRFQVEEYEMNLALEDSLFEMSGS